MLIQILFVICLCLFSVTDAATSSVIKNYLLDFYWAAGGTNWKHNAGWGVGDPLCYQGIGSSCQPWYGIVGDYDTGTITKIQLKVLDQNMVGSLHENVFKITTLTHFEIGWSEDLTGEIPSTIGNLVNLEYLNIYRTGLTGSLPSTFGNLSSIKEIYLSRNSGLNGALPSSMSSITTLEKLLL